ncbi:MAG: iron ABC transporter permease [Propionibacteriaceae bacterium]|nr:iron ABC transporter permease [Propionibacteriaceae bacterium]
MSSVAVSALEPGIAPDRSPGKKVSSKTGMKSLNRLVRQPILLITVLSVFVLLFIFVVLPMFNVIKIAFSDENGFTWDYLIKGLSKPVYQRTFLRSIILGVIVAFTSTAVGYLFAFATTRTEMKGKKFFNIMATLPIISPPFVVSLSIIFLFGRQGLITRGLLGIKDANVYGLPGLVVVQTMSFFPVAYMTLRGILMSLDDSVEDAAFSMGASRGRIFRTVTLPLTMPGIISALLLVFIQSMEDFSNPAVIGGGFSTLSVDAYRIINGMNDMNMGCMLAIMLLAPTVCAYLLQKYWMRKKSFVTVSGKPTQARRKLHEKHIVYPLFAGCCFFTGVIILLYGTVLMGAFVQTWGVNYVLTLKHFSYVLTLGAGVIKNSVILAAVAAPIGGFLGMVIAYLTVRQRFPGRRLMEIASMLMFAIPGIVSCIGYVATFNTKPLLLTGTAVILVATFTFRNIPVAIESGTSTLLQIDTSIDEAATISGAGTWYSFRTITLPMLRNAFLSGLTYSFVRAMTAVSAVILLISPHWNLATTKVFALFEASQFSDAAAYVVIMIVIILAAMGIINLLVNLLLKPRAKAPSAEAVEAALQAQGSSK